MEIAEKDVDAPRIRIVDPQIEQDVPYASDKDELIIVLEVTDQSKIRFIAVENEIQLANEKALYSFTVPLNAGTNEILIRSMDEKENRAEQFYSVEYIPPVITLADKIHMESTYYGLIIGIDEYEDENLDDLDHPVADGSALFRVLTGKYGFEQENVTFLKNPERDMIISELDILREKVTSNDNLLIFYAGHGFYDKHAQIGYWLPSDARAAGTADWFENSSLVNQLRGIRSRHTLLITDACFAGSIFKSRTVDLPEEMAYERIYEIPSRKAMTSGNMSEVPDKSAFVKYLVQKLEGNDGRYYSAEELFNDLKMAVMSNSHTLPRYGDIQNVGSEGGDFIFLNCE